MSVAHQSHGSKHQMKPVPIAGIPVPDPLTVSTNEILHLKGMVGQFE